MKKLTIAAAILGAFVSTNARADHWMQTADPATLYSVNELLTVYNTACNRGIQSGCQTSQYIQQLAGQMFNADFECKMNRNGNACQFAQYSYNQLSQVYSMTQQAMARGVVQQPTGGGDGTTHAQRMQQIHNWGQQRLEYGRRSQALMDQRHQQFMKTLRQ